MTVASIGVVALGANVLQFRYLDQAWRVTVHAFEGTIVHVVIAVMEARHAHLSTKKGGNRSRSSTNSSFHSQALRAVEERQRDGPMYCLSAKRTC